MSMPSGDTRAPVAGTLFLDAEALYRELLRGIFGAFDKAIRKRYADAEGMRVAFKPQA